MNGLFNVERSFFNKGRYIGYAHGVWHITKINSACGKYQAVKRTDIKQIFFGNTLKEISEQLARFDPEGQTI